MDTMARTDLFFVGQADEWAVFERFKGLALARWPDTQLRVMKTCISFDDPKPYCYVSHPPRKSMNGLLVTFGLKTQMGHPRFFQIVPVSKNRYTVHVLVRTPEEADEELFSFLDLARER